jgi:hypothetical protein
MRTDTHLKEWRKIPILSTDKEFMKFINQSLETNDGINRKVKIGEITKKTKQRMGKIYGRSVSNIGIDNNGVIHAVTKKHHNIEPDDLLYAVDVINTTENINLSDKKHQDCDVLEFKKNINGDIVFLTEIHPSKNYLMIFDVMRRKKARRRPDVIPGAHALNDPPPAVTSSVDQSSPVVKGKNKDKE